MSQGVSILVHGLSKAGKSTFAATSPAPRLILDAEAGSRFVPGRKIVWDPVMQQPPQADGSWDTCMVYVHSYDSVTAALRWLQSGNHPFASVIIDSISEVQQRCVDALVGIDQMKIADWGSLLRIVSDTIRKFRDLITHPTRPLWSVVFIAMTREVSGKWRPFVQGALADTLPYYVDICGYLFINPEPAGPGWPGNVLLVSPNAQYESGERVGGCLGPVVVNPNVSSIIQSVLQAQGLTQGVS